MARLRSVYALTFLMSTFSSALPLTAVALNIECKQVPSRSHTPALGQIVITPRFDFASRFHEGFARVLINNKWGYIDTAGRIVIEPQFDRSSDFWNGMAVVSIGGSNGRFGVINRVGSFIINPKYDDVFYSTEYITLAQKNGDWVYLDTKGNISNSKPSSPEAVTVFISGEIDGSSGRLSLVLSKPKTILSSADFDKVEPTSDGCHRLVAVRIGDDKTGKWGFVDFQGRFIINPRYSEVFVFSEGLVAVNFGSREAPSWGFVDQSGKTIIRPQFEKAGIFTSGLAAVKSNGKIGYINKSGGFVIPPRFEHDLLLPFEGDLLPVKFNGKWGFISR